MGLIARRSQPRLDNPSVSQMKQEQRDDPYCATIVTELRQDEPGDHFVDEQGILRYRLPNRRTDRIVVPSALRETMLHLFHSAPFSGHFGIDRTFARLAAQYTWPKMRRDVKDFVDRCLSCRKIKTPAHGIYATYEPFDLPRSQPFDTIAIDIVQMCTAGPYKYLLTCVDWATRWPEAIPIERETAEAVAHALVGGVFARHGFPKYLVSDNGPQFHSQVVDRIARASGLTHAFVSPYHHQANGQVERFHRTLKAGIKHYLDNYQERWLEYLPFILYAYRTTPVEDLKDTPFHLLYGRDARHPTDWHLDSPLVRDVPSFKDRVEAQQRALETAQERATRARDRRRRLFDKRRKRAEFPIGSLVLLYVPAIRPGRASKLAIRWHGPFRVIKKLCNATWVVQDVKTSGRQVAHASRLVQYEPWMPFEKQEHIDAKEDMEESPEEIKVDHSSVPDSDDAKSHEEDAEVPDVEPIIPPTETKTDTSSDGAPLTVTSPQADDNKHSTDESAGDQTANDGDYYDVKRILAHRRGLRPGEWQMKVDWEGNHTPTWQNEPGLRHLDAYRSYLAQLPPSRRGGRVVAPEAQP